jgi:hypothetical protein
MTGEVAGITIGVCAVSGGAIAWAIASAWDAQREITRYLAERRFTGEPKPDDEEVHRRWLEEREEQRKQQAHDALLRSRTGRLLLGVNHLLSQWKR